MPQIHSGVRLGGTTYVPGDEEALAEVITDEQVEYLEGKDVISGFGSGSKSLDDMTKDELVAYAEANEIEVNASDKKAEIRAAIDAAEGGE